MYIGNGQMVEAPYSGQSVRVNSASRSDYVRAIEIYAKQMTHHPYAFPAYYHWQVYVLTKDGDMQLSGPGADG